MDHPLRVALHHELHARPSLDIDGPALVVHVAHLTPQNGWRGLPGVLAAAAVGSGPHAPLYGLADLAGNYVKWERHTEFLTVKVVMPLPPGAPAWPAPDATVADLLAAIPGERIVALLVRVASDTDLELPPSAGSPERAVASTIGGGEATVWSDLRIAGDGFARILLLGHRLTPFRAGWSVRRLIEIETYRMMALLGLARARELQPELSALERRVTAIVGRVAATEDRDDRLLLREVGELSAEFAVLLPGIRFRLSATQAYGQIVLERIGELREDRVPGYHRLGMFVARRFQPALRTCAAAERRLEQVVGQMGHAADLLSTRVQVELEAQNALVLRSMEQRTKAQLQLQTAVEGLSVVVLSYYVVGLIGIAAKGLSSLGLPAEPNVVGLVALPLVVGILVWSSRRVRRGLQD